MFAFIVHSPLTKAKPALGLPLILIPITTRNERFALICPACDLLRCFYFTPPGECPLNFNAWQRELSFDFDKEFILDGLQNGFKLLKSQMFQALLAMTR